MNETEGELLLNQSGAPLIGNAAVALDEESGPAQQMAFQGDLRTKSMKDKLIQMAQFMSDN